MGDGHHLHSDGARLRLSGGGGGLVQPAGAGLAGVDHDGGRFCLEAVDEALARHGRPEIFNTDQGSQFTSVAFTGLLLDNGDRDQHGRPGAWRDNVFVERLWRSVKYEEVYLRAYDTVGEAACLDRPVSGFLQFQKRPHSSLDAQTPDDAYFTQLPQTAAA